MYVLEEEDHYADRGVAGRGEEGDELFRHRRHRSSCSSTSALPPRAERLHRLEEDEGLLPGAMAQQAAPRQRRRTEFTLDTRASLALFGSFTSTDYVASQCIRRRIMHYHMEAFKKVDVIATPTTGITAPKIPPSALKSGESNYVVSAYLMRFIIAGNFIGLPAITVPVGHDKQGLPIGLQLIGRPWGEASLLRVASAVEELSLKKRNRPSAFHDILKA